MRICRATGRALKVGAPPLRWPVGCTTQTTVGTARVEPTAQALPRRGEVNRTVEHCQCTTAVYASRLANFRPYLVQQPILSLALGDFWVL
jgi:hypothetical protein